MPRQIVKSTEAIIGTTSVIERAAEESGERRVENAERSLKPYKTEDSPLPKAAEADDEGKARLMAMTKEQLRKEIHDRQRKMQLAAKELDFMAAAKYRDEIKEMQSLLETAR